MLTKNRGLNRFAWNLRYPNPKILPFGYFGGLLDFVEYTLADHAIPGRTPRDQPEGPLAVPGQYTVTLSAAGKSERQTLTIKPDPRARTSEADLESQFALATRVTDALAATYDSFLSLKELRATVAARVKALSDGQPAKDSKSVKNGKTAVELKDAVQAFDKKLERGSERNQRGTRRGNREPRPGALLRDAGERRCPACGTASRVRGGDVPGADQHSCRMADPEHDRSTGSQHAARQREGARRSRLSLSRPYRPACLSALTLS